MDKLGEVLQKILALDSQSESAARSSYESRPWEERKTEVLEWTHRKMEEYNRSKGNLDPSVYDCKYCLNRGYVGYVDENENGMIYERFIPCDCLRVRNNMAVAKKSGMGDNLEEYTFDSFEVKDPYQRIMLDTAKRYLETGADKGKWLFIGGQSGSGKTHICTAVAGRLMQEEKTVTYAVWPQIVRRLKGFMVNPSDYDVEMAKYQETDVLYLDDFLKPLKDGAETAGPQMTDIKIALELLNFRYTSRLPTLISSELYLDEITAVDEAIGGRISERSAGYTVIVGRDKAKNYRFGHNWEEGDSK